MSHCSWRGGRGAGTTAGNADARACTLTLQLDAATAACALPRQKLRRMQRECEGEGGGGVCNTWTLHMRLATPPPPPPPPPPLPRAHWAAGGGGGEGCGVIHAALLTPNVRGERLDWHGHAGDAGRGGACRQVAGSGARKQRRQHDTHCCAPCRARVSSATRAPLQHDGVQGWPQLR